MWINRHSKPFLKEELKIHEACEGGRRFEFRKKIEIMHIFFTACRGTKQPESLEFEAFKLLTERMNGFSQ